MQVAWHFGEWRIQGQGHGKELTSQKRNQPQAHVRLSGVVSYAMQSQTRTIILTIDSVVILERNKWRRKEFEDKLSLMIEHIQRRVQNYFMLSSRALFFSDLLHGKMMMWEWTVLV